MTDSDLSPHATPRRRHGPEAKPIVEFPSPLFDDWVDPPTFTEAFRLQMRRHGDTDWQLLRAIKRPDEPLSFATITRWSKGAVPAKKRMYEYLMRVEHRYRLPAGYFQEKIESQSDIDPLLKFFTPQQLRQVKWHIPSDFTSYPIEEQEEIVAWIQEKIIVGGTEFRSYQLEWTNRPYGLRFPNSRVMLGLEVLPQRREHRLSPKIDDAPPRLVTEFADWVRFKTRRLTEPGEMREGCWIEASADAVIKRFSLMFGALCADQDGDLNGRGIPREALTMALLVLPDVWDWYIEWHHRKRGFYTAAELEMTYFAKALTRPQYGWLRQRQALAEALVPVPGLLTAEAIAAIRNDWASACDAMYQCARQRRRDLIPLIRIHRDSFEPIRPVLVSDNPLAEYRRIIAEIRARTPCSLAEPRAAAEAVRSLMMVRFGLHLGLRQKNLRELRFRPRGAAHTPTTELVAQRCGELRWCDRRRAWLVFLPAAAFKNATSSFFNGRPFEMELPDLDGLYREIEDYLSRHRTLLLGAAADPGTFFVRTVMHSGSNARFNSSSYYKAYRTITERYGVYNPYTKRGAIDGLLPHGPHSIRDVLATHVLKLTGSFVQAGYAIQDTPISVERCYGRFLPEDKSRIAANLLNVEWGLPRTPLEAVGGGGSAASSLADRAEWRSAPWDPAGGSASRRRPIARRG